jgi:hypothetical protein
MVVPYVSSICSSSPRRFFVASGRNCGRSGVAWPPRFSAGTLFPSCRCGSRFLDRAERLDCRHFREAYGFDRPYNLFPSLHIAILMILSGSTSATRGIVRWLIRGWFGLIGLSTVLTYQHHVIDLGGGFLLRLLCYYLIPDRQPQPVAMNVRIGFLTPPRRQLGVVGTGCGRWDSRFSGLRRHSRLWRARFGLYAGITGKNGGLSLAARIVLAPWLAAQHASRSLPPRADAGTSWHQMS